MYAVYILSESAMEVLVDLVAAANTNEMQRHVVPKPALTGDRFILFDRDSLTFVACGEIASDAAQIPNEGSKHYVSALKFHPAFEPKNGIPIKLIIEANPTWATDFPKWKWIQRPAQGLRPGYATSSKVPDAISEVFWASVLDTAYGKSVWRSWTQRHSKSDHPKDDAQNFYDEVSTSLRDSHSSRQARLATAPKMPDRISTTSVSFRRNPDVVAEVLLRANGTCERCLLPAPFIRASEGTPYLEVHHHVTLASGGEDTVANAIALCPNCHRAAHYAKLVIPPNAAR